MTNLRHDYNKPAIEQVQTCHSNETHATIANLPNTAQLKGTPTIPPSYIEVCAVVWECGKGQTDTQTAVANIHFASAMPPAKVIIKQVSLQDKSAEAVSEQMKVNCLAG